VEVTLMIEGQEDVTWEDWLAIATCCEECGIGTLFRSDHYLSVEDRRERGSLDAWSTIAALGAVTSALRLGTMVSPTTFRHPSVLAKLAVSADHISDGRVELGIGAGWWKREHEAYGFDLPPIGPRLDAMEEQMRIIARQFEPGTFSFAGEHYRVKDLDALPKPLQSPRPPIILGGRGGPRSLRLAVELADEYNTAFRGPAELSELRDKLDAECERQDRDPASLPLSMMTGWLVAESREQLIDRAARLASWRGEGDDGEAFLEGLPDAWIVGTVEEAVEQLRALAAAGCARVMAQHLLHRDLDAIATIGRQVNPQMKGL
jgi:alkanesulfonate monooxygenase SsuD/methylene tetrahydromethanopterin reductase-like flavin-dependent oxidoreductase (luciferase family)